MDKQRRVNPKIISLIVIVLVVAASTAVYAVNNANKNAAVTTDSTSQQTKSSTATTDMPTATTSDSTSGTYKAGSYTETSTYSTPSGSESITVTATLAADGTVTDVSTTGSATRGDSAEYQEQFLAAYKQSVVGKKIDAISLSRVSGASLTSNGFNRALTSIKADAEA